jgi:hypothetical protein
MWRAGCAVAGALVLASCASLNFVHDPHSGPIDRKEVPLLLKSIRCELITFYEANRQRRRLFFADPDRASAVELYPHYELSEKLFGLISLDLKVQDNAGFNGTFDNVQTADAMNSRTWHFGPSLSDQNTYELNWSFLIAQNNRLVRNSKVRDPFECYTSLPKGAGSNLYDFEGLASGAYPELQMFTRIWVVGIKPLAAWLSDNTVETWKNFVAKSREEAQRTKDSDAS